MKNNSAALIKKIDNICIIIISFFVLITLINIFSLYTSLNTKVLTVLNTVLNTNVINRWWVVFLSLIPIILGSIYFVTTSRFRFIQIEIPNAITLWRGGDKERAFRIYMEIIKNKCKYINEENENFNLMFDHIKKHINFLWNDDKRKIASAYYLLLIKNITAFKKFYPDATWSNILNRVLEHQLDSGYTEGGYQLIKIAKNNNVSIDEDKKKSAMMIYNFKMLPYGCPSCGKNHSISNNQCGIRSLKGGPDGKSLSMHSYYRDGSYHNISITDCPKCNTKFSFYTMTNPETYRTSSECKKCKYKTVDPGYDR